MLATGRSLTLATGRSLTLATGRSLTLATGRSLTLATGRRPHDPHARPNRADRRGTIRMPTPLSGLKRLALSNRAGLNPLPCTRAPGGLQGPALRSRAWHVARRRAV